MTKHTAPTPNMTPIIVIHVDTEIKNRPELKYRRAIYVSKLTVGYVARR
jgi:hypothetical protein